ncbi:MAG: 2-C-methyl-D-erythritol 4-phosphate cytidylyltransferase [Oscillospiraceae bacterium]|nr:2-C-methyl-D-erythritol 4-phosphate cytidylyltransferase [Oscillospiraceae bacterium]
MKRKDTAAILVCAGNATRMGGIHKILHSLGDTTVLHQVLRSFCQCESIAGLVVICRKQDIDEFQRSIAEIEDELHQPVTVTAGGETRQQSVQNGVSALPFDAAYIAVHDGARPLIRPADIEHVIADARISGAATLGVPVKDTIKLVQDGIIKETPERALLWQTQTPQVFRLNLYRQAMQLAAEQGKDYTDDCQLMEALGVPVTMTEGAYSNIKLTTPDDFAVAEALLRLNEEEESNG